MAPLRRLAVVAVGWALLLGVTHASPYAVNPPRDLAASLLRSRDFDPQDCRQRMPSNPWDSCQDFLDRYKLTLPRLYHMNPEVETDCYNFIAGEEFCIASVFRLAISTSGSCGLVNGVATTCVGSTFGECCGANGQCGSTEAYCAIGNCQFGNCPGAGYSFNGQCGTQFHNLKCGGQWGSCCSNAGVCGSTSAECGAGNCQSGACEVTATTTPPPASTPTSTPPAAPFLPSPDGTCGYNNEYKCTDTLFYFGNCCSAAGFCSWDETDCRDDYGCQAEYGLCDEYVTVTVTAGTPATTATETPTPTPTPPETVDGFRMLGCFDDLSIGYRALGYDDDWQEELTLESCKAYCVDDRGYYFFGVEYSNECYCGDHREESSTRMDDSECSMPCAGDPSQTCGGDQRINIYGAADTPSHVWLGCRTNTDPGGQVLDAHSLVSNSMTNEVCETECEVSGPFDYYGTEASDTCRCGNALRQSSQAAPNNECNMRCAGDNNWDCGGNQRLTAFGPNPLGPTYIYQGCHTDEDLQEWALDGPWSWSDDQNTPWTCGYFCLYEGYDLFGTEEGGYCVCGSNLRQDAIQTSETECNEPCTGSSETCGAWRRMSLYWWDWSGFHGSSGFASRGAVSAPGHNISAVDSELSSVFTPMTEKKPAARVRRVRA